MVGNNKKEFSAKNNRDLQELTNKAVQFSTLAFARAFCTVAPDLAVWASWPWNCTHRKAMVVLKSSGHDKHQLFSSSGGGQVVGAWQRSRGAVVLKLTWQMLHRQEHFFDLVAVTEARRGHVPHQEGQTLFGIFFVRLRLINPGAGLTCDQHICCELPQSVTLTA